MRIFEKTAKRALAITSSVLISITPLIEGCAHSRIYTDVKGDAPTSTTKGNIVTIETNGKDFELEKFLSKGLNIIVISAAWCSPCTVADFSVQKHAAQFPKIRFIIVKGSYMDEFGKEIDSPFISRAFQRANADEFPIHLILSGSKFLGAIRDKLSIEEVVDQAEKMNDPQ